MARVIGFIIKLGLVVAAAVWLADHPGAVTVDWEGWRLESSVGVVTLAVVVVAIIAALAYRFWRGLVRVPREVREMRRGRRRIAGYRALTQGMVAVAAGEVDEARRLSRRADGLLREPPLTMLLSAQAAQLGGDEAAASRYFTAMLDNPETEFLGLRGLLVQALREDDTGRALDLAARAETLRPGTPWARDALFRLNSRRGDWDAAVAALEPGRGRRADRDAQRRLAAALAARARAGAVPDDASVAAAREALRLAPDLVPAADILARRLSALGRKRRARKILERAWGTTPHPDLVAAYLEVAAPPDSVAAARAVETLTAGAPDHRESRFARATASLDAGLWGAARRELRALDDDPPQARFCRLMARLEEDEDGGGDGAGREAARRWLARLAEAAPDPLWQCGDCGAVDDVWSAVCGRCGEVASLAWHPPQRMDPLPPPALPAPAEPGGTATAGAVALAPAAVREGGAAPAPAAGT